MEKYLFEEIPKILEELIKLDFEERKPILEHLPNFSDFNKRHSFIYTEDFDLVENLILDDIWI